MPVLVVAVRRQIKLPRTAPIYFIFSYSVPATFIIVIISVTALVGKAWTTLLSPWGPWVHVRISCFDEPDFPSGRSAKARVAQPTADGD